ncbi:hypothetical protein [Chitinophaga flava]|uniref:Uncharacterized protein n=1 Tax=Chitinophaga flava TaxID=2259036 RepID=A0A365XUB4_9BACT|nr:hypothetical protein [Chitinophaga flava]RBL89740.1 hypothetical protein DF182_24925 [Chitinophaga flava]
MSKYNLEARYFVLENLRKLDDTLLDTLWQLFVRICKFWQTTETPEAMKSDFLIFISNRIEMDIRYLAEYVNYGDVIQELTDELGEEAAFQKLFTDAAANITPAFTNLARAKQLVVNELIALNLSLGGFKTFGNPAIAQGVPINYPGYIGGMNRRDHTPYRKKAD